MMGVGAVAGIKGMGSWIGLKGKLLLKGVAILAGLGCCWPAEDDELAAAKQLEPTVMPTGVAPTGLSTGDG